MEIVKQLNLNRNNQVVPNGSLVCAKNIKLSADGSFITNDDGFNFAMEDNTPLENLKIKNIGDAVRSGLQGNIVGYINCPNEIVVFTEGSGYSHIYRLIEDINGETLCSFEVRSAWTYNGGKIVGSYYYNINKELIISIGESSDDKLIPVKIINLNTCSLINDESYYNIAPDVPIANCVLSEKLNSGYIPAGVYHFFIRYEIEKNVYTKWFPIGVPYYAINESELLTTEHHALKVYGSGINQQKSKFIIKHPYNNIEEDCNYNLKLNILLDNKLNYKYYQLGYILQHDNAIVGRIWRRFNIDVSTVIFDNKNVKEVGIDELLENPFNCYNVKALTVFDDKLYIANYKETNYNDEIDSNIINAIKPRYKMSNVVVGSETDVNKISITRRTIRIELNSNNKVTYEQDNDDNYNLSKYWDKKLIYMFGQAMNTDPYFLTRPDTQISFDGTNYYDINQITLHYPSFNNVGDFKICPIYDTSVGYSSFWFRSIEASNKVVKYTPRQNGMKVLTTIVVTKTITLINYNNDVPSLDEGEVYSFFVHYVRRDGSYTNGYPIYNDNTDSSYDTTVFPNHKKYEVVNNHNSTTKEGDYYKYIPYKNIENKVLCKTGQNIESGHRNVIFPCFLDVVIPDGYVGVFFSYEKIEATKLFEGKIEFISSKTSNGETTYIYKIHSFEPEFTLSDYKGDFTCVDGTNYLIKKSYIRLSNVLDNVISTFGQEGGVYIELDTELNITNNIVSVHTFNISCYSNADKRLISLGYIMTTNGNYDTSVNTLNFNLPNIIQKQYKLVIEPTIKTLKLDDYGLIAQDGTHLVNGITIDSEGQVLLVASDGLIGTRDYAIIETGRVNEKGYYVLTSFVTSNKHNYKCISVKKAPEFITTTITILNEGSGFEQYMRTAIDTVVKPENLSDLFEFKNWYKPDSQKEYANIDEDNKYISDFTNTIRVSNPYRSEALENSIRLFNSDDYYIIDKNKGDIINIFGSGKSFYVHTVNTLLVTSADAKLTADNTNITLQNNNIFDIAPQELFSSDLGQGGLKYRECAEYTQYGYIWYDTCHYKIYLLFNNSVKDLTADIQELINYFRFEKCYFNVDNRTDRIFIHLCQHNKSDYSDGLTLAISTLTNNFISIYDFKFNKSLRTNDNIYFVHDYSSIFVYDSNIKGYDELTNVFDLFPNLYNNSPYVDIIFNENFEIVKQIETIVWLHEFINNSSKFDNNFIDFNRLNKIRYKDNLKDIYIQIYTNASATDILPLFSEEDDEKAKNILQTSYYYKYPWYDKGVWHFNYLRALSNGSTNDSDDRTLIYGNYFIVRFVFNINNVNNKLMFNNVDINYKSY